MAIPLAGATSQAPYEKAVLDRANKFYSLILAKQYRQAEMFISKGDRETYYATEKPLIFDYQIKKVTLDAKHKIATLDMESTTKVHRPMIGEMKIPLSYLSHWKLESGTWYWYIPNQEVRETPFGTMVFAKKGAGSASEDTLKKNMADAPSAAAVLTGVKADRTQVVLGDKPGDSVTVNLKNTLAGRVRLISDLPSNPLFTFQVTPTELEAGKEATMVVKRVSAGKLPPTGIVVKVTPTQQQIKIEVR